MGFRSWLKEDKHSLLALGKKSSVNVHILNNLDICKKMMHTTATSGYISVYVYVYATLLEFKGLCWIV